ncbi:phosphatidylinositol-4-phosphate-5-kinase (PIPK-D6/GPCR-PIPK) [Achlya hypogyna]|uniref:Phosphatidylinositol-4-phosphate-5-kinase (PIPK-D6/GPCR-PIPK) n=1 Tax=Achlya hypogyna TaxID=1202772 RepID=A0A1V9ZMZ7_ACHHY|nr:phosphatidylinositol-4-phosphate-5-kinase (PIPK-D6/GPCR-PIPK) [Achlya hypogyna]
MKGLETARDSDPMSAASTMSTDDDAPVLAQTGNVATLEGHAPSAQQPSMGPLKEIYLLVRGRGEYVLGTIVATAAATIFSVVLFICAIAFRDKTDAPLKIPSGVLLGSIGTLIISGVVIFSYVHLPACRNHSNILLLNRCICDLLLALTFILEPAWNHAGGGVESGMSCAWLSTVREYFIMTSTCWEFCMALDLFSLLNDPFTSPRKNRRKYQIISHTSGLVAAAIMLSDDRFHGVSVGNFCWVKCSQLKSNTFVFEDAGIWVFIAAPVTLFIGTNIYVCTISMKRFNGGIEASLDHRRTLLREGFLTTIAFVVYWVLLWGIYVAFWLAGGSDVLKELFGFLLSFRSVVVFFLWILYSTSEKNIKQSAAERDDATRAQTNYALLKELVFYTTCGITKAVQVANKRQSLELGDTSIFTVHPPQNHHALFSCQECKFTDFRSDVFGKLRECFSIDERAFIQSFADCSIPKVSEGSSGSFMFFTTNGAYIVKSLTRRESCFLNTIVDDYAAYVAANPKTFLTRILGSYSMELYGRESHFVVMENLFDKQHAVHHRYDIKGSWVDRNAEKARFGTECTCRYCNMAFRSGARDACPNRAGFHSPNVVLKDMDLTTKVRLGHGQASAVVAQLKADSSFLCAKGIMDYSLLLGVIEVRFQVNVQSIVRDDSNPLHLPSLDVLSSTVSSPGSGGMEKQSMACLRSADVVVGPGFYYIGVIDILQTWTWEKRIERWFKTLVLRKDPDGISALPPKPYRDRFHRKLDEIIHVPGPDGPSPHVELPDVPLNKKVYPVETVLGDLQPSFSFRNDVWQGSPTADIATGGTTELEDADVAVHRTELG